MAVFDSGFSGQVSFIVSNKNRVAIPCAVGTFSIAENSVVVERQLAAHQSLASRTLPNNLIPIIPALPTKHRIAYQLEVVARGRVAVEVEAAGGLEHALDFDDPLGHVDEVGEQAAVPEHLFQPLDQRHGLLGQRARIQPVDIGQPRQPRVRLRSPFPGIDERLRLCAVLAALVVVDLEVVALGIERRVDIAQIDAVAVDPVAQEDRKSVV